MSAAAAPADGFTYSGAELDALAEARNYYGWISGRFAPYLGARVVEAGAGIGTFTQYLLERSPGARVVAVEPAANNFPWLQRRFADHARVQPVQGYLGEAQAEQSADSVVAVNVMEHISDDAAFLASARRVLAPGGHLLLFVPALPAIFGSLDRAFEHCRRYRRPELLQKLRGAGLEPLEVRYMNLPGVAAWWLAGRVLRRTTVKPGDARVYDRWVVPWVKALESRWSPPLGQSLLAIARRPAGVE